LSRLLGVLSDVAKLLDSQKLDWALVGGLAVSARTEPRFTRDVDLVVAVASDQVAEDLSRKLLAAGYSILSTVEQDAANRLATIRLEPPGEPAGGVVVDMLFASSGIEPEIAAGAERIEIASGQLVPVATIGHLIAQKILSRDDESRPQDIVDLRALLKTADREDLDTASDALRLIASRGYARERDVLAEFHRLTRS
jgi:hypothetical protein